jgi:hypothetical protein
VATQAFVATTENVTIVDQHAQELYSLFMLTMAAEIKSIGPSTTLPPNAHSPTPRLWDNRLISHLAEIAVDCKIVGGLEEGLMLVVPAFAHHGLLPDRKSLAEWHPCGARSASVRLPPSLESSIIAEEYGADVTFGPAENAVMRGDCRVGEDASRMTGSRHRGGGGREHAATR